MLPGLVEGAYTLPALAANHQRCINLLVEVDQRQGKTPGMLINVPGLRDVSTLGTGAVKNLIEVNGELFGAVGQTFGKINAAGAFTALGSFNGTARVTLVANGLQVLVIDGLSGFVWDIAAMTWTQITDPGFVYGATQATFQDGYGIVGLPNSQQFGISGLYDFLTWDAIDFASAEGLPDDVATVVSNNRYLHVFGSSTLELWVNTGGSAANGNFPFERVGGTFFQVGCAAPYSAVIADDSVFWLGNNDQGALRVFRMNGQTPAAVSTPALERELADYARDSRVDDAFGFGLDVGKHPLYVLVFPSADRTWVYDTHSQQWSEWLEWAAPTWKRTRMNCFASAFGKLLTGDYRDGRLYQITFDEFTNGGDPLRWLRMSPYVWKEGKRAFHSRLELFIEVGHAPQTGAASAVDPEVLMRFSDDGHTWSAETPRRIGRIGEYGVQPIWNRLGSAFNRMYEFSGSAAVRTTIMGASIEVR